MLTDRSSRCVRFVLCATAALAAVAGLLAAPATATPARTAVVTGVVTGADGLPLQHVTVRAQFQVLAFPPVTIASAVTKADGSYRLTVDLDDSENFSVDTLADQATGGTSATGYADTCYQKPANSGCTSLQPRAGSTTRAVDLVLPRAAEITGRLTDAQGRGVGKVSVYPWPISDCSFLDVGPTLPGTTSDLNGNYRITRLPAGTTTVCVSSPFVPDAGVPAVDGYNPVTFTVTPLAGRVTTHNVRLVAGGGVAGTVVDQFGAPVAGASVSVTTDFTTRTATSTADGGFRVGRIATGRHTWCVTAPRYADNCGRSVAVASGKTTQLGTIVLRRVS